MRTSLILLLAVLATVVCCTECSSFSFRVTIDDDNPSALKIDKTMVKNVYTDPIFGSNHAAKQKEKPCCFPRVRTAQMYRYVSLEYTEFAATLYEDDDTKQMAADIVETVGNSSSPTDAYTLLLKMDGTTAYFYRFNKETKNCDHQVVYNTSFDEMTQHCVPNDAMYVGQFPMGIPNGGASFLVRAWTWKAYPQIVPDLQYEVFVTSDCAPVLGIARGVLDGDRPVLQTDYYFNIQTTIKDRSVFDLPDFCKKEHLTGDMRVPDKKISTFFN